MLIAGALTEKAAAGEWTPGSVEQGYFYVDTMLDLDGDSIADYQLHVQYGGLIYLEALTVNGINNQIFATDNHATSFETRDDVLSATGGTIAAPDGAVLASYDFWGFPYEPARFVGVVFEIPGGSPYFGYLQLTADIWGYVQILDTGYQPYVSVGTEPGSWSAIKKLYAGSKTGG